MGSLCTITWAKEDAAYDWKLINWIYKIKELIPIGMEDIYD